MSLEEENQRLRRELDEALASAKSEHLDSMAYSDSLDYTCLALDELVRAIDNEPGNKSVAVQLAVITAKKVLVKSHLELHGEVNDLRTLHRDLMGIVGHQEDDGESCSDTCTGCTTPIEQLRQTLQQYRDDLYGVRGELRNTKRDADRLADEVAVLVRRDVIGSRSPAADALLDYRDPPSSERADRLAHLEREVERVAAERDRMYSNNQALYKIVGELKHLRDEAIAQNDGLRRALGEYGQHNPICRVEKGGRECNCGFHAALSTPTKQQEKAELGKEDR